MEEERIMSYGYNEYRLTQIDQQLTPEMQNKDPTYYQELLEEKQQLLQEMLHDTHYKKNWRQTLIDKGGNY